MSREEELLHERLMNGTADPGMYPDHWFNCLGQGDTEEAYRERQREAEAQEDAAREAAEEPS